MNRIQQFFTNMGHWALHHTLYRGRPGEVYFFGVGEENNTLSTDGKVIVQDSRFNKQVAHAFHFENRYFTQLPIGRRVHAVQQAIMKIDGCRFSAIVEGDRVYTPYGHYDRVPSRMQAILDAKAVAPDPSLLEEFPDLAEAL
jgi:hypothetical protein